jgi:hypothetical protein
LIRVALGRTSLFVSINEIQDGYYDDPYSYGYAPAYGYATDIVAHTMAMAAITRAIVTQGITPILAITIGAVPTTPIVATRAMRRLDDVTRTHQKVG